MIEAVGTVSGCTAALIAGPADRGSIGMGLCPHAVSVSTMDERLFQAIYALRNAFLARREAPANEAFALGTEGDTRRQTQSGLGNQLLAERQAVADTVHFEKGI